ncbi:MAG: PilZ domain-containing protein [Rhodanobacteraceae bacterium]
MVEKRRFPRKRTDVLIKVLDTMTDAVIGRVGNLSTEGMLLLADHPIADDALYQLRFALPDAHGGNHTIGAGVHEHWSDEGHVPGQSWVGFRFIDISQEDADALSEWLVSGEDIADAARGR